MNRSSPSPSTVILLVLLAALTQCARGDFGLEHLIHLYDLHIGSTENCLQSLEVTDDDLLLTYGDFKLNDKQCDKGMIQLYENGDALPISELLLADQELYGGYLATKTNARISCDGPFIDDGTPLVFFKPNKDVILTALVLFGPEGATDLGEDVNAEDEITLKKETKYVAVGQKCLFKAVKTGVSACFPGDAMVHTVSHDGGLPIETRMHDVVTGDYVRSEAQKNAKVYAWSHRNHHVKAQFVHISTHDNQSIALSAAHYIPVMHGAHRRLVAAEHVMENQMSLIAADGALKTVTQVRKNVWKTGLFNPQTTDGYIVVNGFVVSTFTRFVNPAAANAALLPVRALLPQSLAEAVVSFFSHAARCAFDSLS